MAALNAIEPTHGTNNGGDAALRHDWTKAEVEALFALPFNDLMFEAQKVHRQYFDANRVQLSTLVNIKTGGCPEDCKYCPQSAHFETGLDAGKLVSNDEVREAALKAKAKGASRLCMGAAWRNPKDHQLDQVIEMIREVKQQGLESCVTLGMLTDAQAKRLKLAGLDYYNHNVDTSEEYYSEIITTRTYQDRLDTLSHVRDAGIHVCSGGIVGMGETRQDRAAMLVTLANLPTHPESVPINRLVQVKGTPLDGVDTIEGLEFVRTIAVARIMMPKSTVRLSAGRENMDDALQALCFLAGANSIFYGEKLLTTANPDVSRDTALFQRLGLQPAEPHELRLS